MFPQEKALQVELSQPDPAFDSGVRINFGIVYAVEHNVKVMDIGLVSDHHLPRLMEYFIQANS